MEERETFLRSTCLTKSSFRSRRNFAFPRSSGRPRIIQIESMEKGECESIELEHQNEDSLRGEDELHLGSLMELEKNLSETRARLSSAIEAASQRETSKSRLLVQSAKCTSSFNPFKLHRLCKWMFDPWAENSSHHVDETLRLCMLPPPPEVARCRNDHRLSLKLTRPLRCLSSLLGLTTEEHSKGRKFPSTVLNNIKNLKSGSLSELIAG